MTVRHLLYRIRANAFKIAHMIELRDFLRSACLPHAISYGNTQIDVSKSLDATGDKLAKAATIDKEINRRMSILERDTAIASALIEKVGNEKNRRALTLFFLTRVKDGAFTRPMTAEEAAGEMGISEGYLRVLCHRGMDAMRRYV